MKIGFGIISVKGRGKEKLQNDSIDKLFVEQEVLKDKEVLKGMRRADRFAKMATLAAYDAYSDLSSDHNAEKVGLITSTQFGPHASTFKFLDDILDHDDSQTSPTVFSHSVHNAATHYIATSLAIRGPASTVTIFDNPYAAALDLAFSWLEQGLAKTVLVGYVEERSIPMDYISSALMEKHGLESPQEFIFSPVDKGLISEGACFLACHHDQRELLPVIANDMRTGVISCAEDLLNLLSQ